MIKNNLDKEYMEIVHDILNLKEFQATKDIKHHGNGVYEHSLDVSYLSYKIAKKVNADYVCAARAGMLHDFFYFDWRSDEAKERRKKYKGIEKITKMHGFAHPFEAYENASKYFTLNKREKDVIIKHMFPLSPILPKYIESWIVSAADKIIATKEICSEVLAIIKSILSKKTLFMGQGN
nr:HD domain-containing protein [Sedimentibacter sp.]